MNIRMRWTAIAVLMCAGIAAAAALATAGDWKTLNDSDWCRESHGGWDHAARVCEVREITLKADRDVVRVDAETNGGISVKAWDKNEIRVRVKVQAWSRKGEDEARKIADKVTVDTSGHVIRPDGPDTGSREGWSVSFRLMVPKKSNLDLTAHNGGIGVTGVDGKIAAETTNGGLSLQDLAGDVRARTTNGGVSVRLEGTSWDGEGLDVRSTNGGVHVEIPEHYNAELETGTVNGGLNLDFPVKVQGRLGKSIKTTLGEGGPRIRVRTTNGGVRIAHS